MEQSIQPYAVGSFWGFVRRTVSRDKELLLYFGSYTLLSIIPLPTYFYVMALLDPHPRTWHFAPLALVWFLNLFILRFFQFAVARTLIQRESNKKPTIESTLKYSIRNLPLIFKLALANYLFDLLFIVIGSIIDAIFKHFRPVSRLLAHLIFGVADTSAQVFLGFLIPIAVCSPEKNLKALCDKTSKMIHNNFWGGLLIGMKLSLVLAVIMTVMLISLTALPNYLSQNVFRAVLLSEFYFIMLIAQGFGMCATLLYSKMTVLAMKGGLTPEELNFEMSKLGVRVKK